MVLDQYCLAQGGATEPYQTPSWVTVFIAVDQPPPHIPSMWVSVFESIKVSPPHLTSMWVSVFLLDDGDTTAFALNVGKCVLAKVVETTQMENNKIKTFIVYFRNIFGSCTCFPSGMIFLEGSHSWKK